MSGFVNSQEAVDKLKGIEAPKKSNGIENVGKDVGKAIENLGKKAFQTSKAYLQGINDSINQAAKGFNDLSKNIGAIFQKTKKKGAGDDDGTDKPEEPPFRFGNEEPYIFGGYSVTINGRELGVDRLAYITDITIEQNVGKTDTCEIKVKDPNMYFIEDDVYMRNTPIQCSITLLNNGVDAGEDMMNRMYFDGYIAAIDIDFPDDGAPNMTIHCVDKPTHEMNRKKWRRSWENVNSAQVVQIIAQEMGYQCYIEEDYSFPIQSTIIQDNKTNIEFLEELASKELDLFVCHTVYNPEGAPIIYYVIRGKLDKEDFASVGYRLSNISIETDKMKQVSYDVLSFNPQINVETREDRVESSEINHDTKEIESHEADVDEAVDNEESSNEDKKSSGSSGDGMVNISLRG